MKDWQVLLLVAVGLWFLSRRGSALAATSLPSGSLSNPQWWAANAPGIPSPLNDPTTQNLIATFGL